MVDRAHTFTTATGGGFEQYWVAHIICGLLESGRVLVVAVIAGNQRHIGFCHNVFCGGFGAHGQDCLDWGAYKNEIIGVALAAEVGVF